jgi:hypothetical protein
LLEARVFEHRRALIGKRPIEIGRVAVALLFDRDDQALSGEAGQHLGETAVDGLGATVQQQQGR